MKSSTDKMKWVIIGLVLLLGVTGYAVYKSISSTPAEPEPEIEEISELVPDADPTIVVDLSMSKAKANTVVLSVSNLQSKYSTVGYELTYDSQGLIKGVNSGSKPIEVAGEDGFEREVYLGTCSRNVCKPDLGVEKVSVVLEFVDTTGKKSQMTKEFEV